MLVTSLHYTNSAHFTIVSFLLRYLLAFSENGFTSSFQVTNIFSTLSVSCHAFTFPNEHVPKLIENKKIPNRCNSCCQAHLQIFQLLLVIRVFLWLSFFSLLFWRLSCSQCWILPSQCLFFIHTIRLPPLLLYYFEKLVQYSEREIGVSCCVSLLIPLYLSLFLTFIMFEILNLFAILMIRWLVSFMFLIVPKSLEKETTPNNCNFPYPRRKPKFSFVSVRFLSISNIFSLSSKNVHIPRTEYMLPSVCCLVTYEVLHDFILLQKPVTRSEKASTVAALFPSPPSIPFPFHRKIQFTRRHDTAMICDSFALLPLSLAFPCFPTPFLLIRNKLFHSHLPNY